jgi:hypothetical protein
MKKMLFVMLMLVVPALFAAPLKPIDKGAQGLSKQIGSRQSHGLDWNNYTPDPAFSYGIKAQRQLCDLIEETCKVLETYWINGSDDVGRCNTTPVAIANEINVYANLEHANRVMIRCNNSAQFANLQLVADNNLDGINEVSKFFRWTFSVVRQAK